MFIFVFVFQSFSIFVGKHTSICINFCKLILDNNKMNKEREHRRIWTQEEDDVLRTLVELSANPAKPKWKKISEQLNRSKYEIMRNPKQCRERWLNSLAPTSQNSRPWGPEDDLLLIRSCKKYGRRWSQLSKEFDNTINDNRLKNHFYSTVRKVIRIINNVVKQARKQYQENAKNSNLEIYSEEHIELMKEIVKMRSFQQKYLTKIFSLIDGRREYLYQAKESLEMDDLRAVNNQILQYMEDFVSETHQFEVLRVLKMVASVMQINRTIKNRYIRQAKLSLQEISEVQKQQQNRKKRYKKINEIIKSQLKSEIIPDRKTKDEILNKIKDGNKQLTRLMRPLQRKRLIPKFHQMKVSNLSQSQTPNANANVNANASEHPCGNNNPTSAPPIPNVNHNINTNTHPNYNINTSTHPNFNLNTNLNGTGSSSSNANVNQEIFKNQEPLIRDVLQKNSNQGLRETDPPPKINFGFSFDYDINRDRGSSQLLHASNLFNFNQASIQIHPSPNSRSINYDDYYKRSLPQELQKSKPLQPIVKQESNNEDFQRNLTATINANTNPHLNSNPNPLPNSNPNPFPHPHPHPHPSPNHPFASNFLNNIPVFASNSLPIHHGSSLARDLEVKQEVIDFREAINPFFPEQKLTHSQGYFVFDKPQTEAERNVNDLCKSNPNMGSMNFAEMGVSQPKIEEEPKLNHVRHSQMFDGMLGSINYSSNMDQQSQRMKCSLFDFIPNFPMGNTFCPPMFLEMNYMQDPRLSRAYEGNKIFSSQNFNPPRFNMQQSLPMGIDLYRSSDLHADSNHSGGMYHSYSYGQLSIENKSNNSKKMKK